MNISKMNLRPGTPDFSDLPWGLPLYEWDNDNCAQLVDVPHGISRHPVKFLNYSGAIFAFKDMPNTQAVDEYKLLLQIENSRVPSVIPVGYVVHAPEPEQRSVLITQYLEHAIPYRTLFAQTRLLPYRKHLLDAIAGLIVQLHLACIYWGDCSLSNTLFRRDAGALQAYLVDAETAEFYADDLPPTIRHHELEIMEENITGELIDLEIDHKFIDKYNLMDIGAYIRLRYQSLWEEITREDVIKPDENYRIQERIRALNELGFSVSNVELRDTVDGNQLRLRVIISDRNFHQDQLINLTGLEAEERQARLMMNEIHQIKARLSQEQNRSTPLSVAAHHWLTNIYLPIIALLEPFDNIGDDKAELYCQILENKWYLSEQAKRDVGHRKAAEDYIERFATL